MRTFVSGGTGFVGTTDQAQAGDAQQADSAAALSCVDILSAFRASGAQYQYDDLKLERDREFDLVSDERLQECLAREVIDRDAVKGAKLVDTGGLPLVLIAALVLTSLPRFAYQAEALLSVCPARQRLSDELTQDYR